MATFSPSTTNKRPLKEKHGVVSVVFTTFAAQNLVFYGFSWFI